MKIAFFSVAYKNAGDYLIELRGIELLKYVYPDAEIVKILRNQISENISIINKCDVGIIGGGPIYQQDICRYLPLDDLIHNIHIPLMVLGGGWYGKTDNYSYIYNYNFAPKTLELLQKIDKQGLGLSCRDLYTYRALLKEGLKNVYMTGCPAWFDIDYLNKTPEFTNWNDIKKIVISDPAILVNVSKAVHLVEYLISKFPKADFIFLFHRGYNRDRYTSEQKALIHLELKNQIESMKTDGGGSITVQDISYSSNGFKIYDDCDLHIGFRVHAHLYNLSKKNRSILIQEDGRGAGANQVFGLPQLKAYSDYVSSVNYLKKIMHKKKNNIEQEYKHLIEDVDSYINILKQTNDQYLYNAFELQKQYFNQMISFIKRISEVDGIH